VSYNIIMTYFFILGNNPTLSIAEILKTLNHGIQVKQISNKVLILEIARKIDLDSIQKKLGGTIKTGQILSSLDSTKVPVDKIIDLLPKNLNKVYFGFSIYQLSDKVNLTDLNRRIKGAALRIKKKLKEQGVSSRWVTSRKRILSSVIVQKNKLLDKGAEFVFLVGSGKVLLGQTFTCQAFAEYSFRDFSRPARLIEKGMIPPKLAKIMINLASVGQQGILLDPFCGSGTILQEALLLGFPNLIGTDISDQAVKNTEQNLEWLAQKLKVQTRNVKLLKTDIGQLSQKLTPWSIEAIITEPYLGPAKISNSKLSIQNLISELSGLYLSAFREFRKILKPIGKIVIIFPVFKTKKELYFLPILDEIKREGWQLASLVPDDLLKNPTVKITSRGSIIYSRPGQRVLREIFIIKQ